MHNVRALRGQAGFLSFRLGLIEASVKQESHSQLKGSQILR